MRAQDAKTPKEAASVRDLSWGMFSTASPPGRLILASGLSFFGGGLYLGTSANLILVSTSPLSRFLILCTSSASYAASTLLPGTPSASLASFAATIASKEASAETSSSCSASSGDIVSEGASFPSELLFMRTRRLLRPEKERPARKPEVLRITAALGRCSVARAGRDCAAILLGLGAREVAMQRHAIFPVHSRRLNAILQVPEAGRLLALYQGYHCSVLATSTAEGAK
mmetsp:Transcript_6045/g.10921  ORF Transcript_6045/g.10921 Transcript_6045/m.10921 type:complete len:228 (-) Transcript_6045:49-732(-)